MRVSSFEGLSSRGTFDRLERLYLYGIHDPFVVIDLIRLAKLRPPGERCWNAEYETLTYWIDAVLLKHPQTAPDLLPELTRLLVDDDPAVRELAARCLGELGPNAAKAVLDLRERLVDPDSHVVIEAAKALSRIVPADAASDRALEGRLESADASVVVAALLAAERMGPRGRPLIPAIAAHLESANTACRMLAALALIEIAPDHDPIINRVRALEADSDSDVRSLVTRHLLGRGAR